MNKNIASALCGAMLLGGVSGAAHAVDVSANVSLLSDYSLRGVSQTTRDPAVQGGFDLEFDSGFYAGTWASNVAFDGASLEMNFYVGYGGEINENISYDVNFTRFEYPGDGSNLDYNELGGSLSFGSATLGLIYSNEYFALDSVRWFYPYFQYSFALPSDMSLDLHVAYSIVDDNSAGDWEDAFGDDRVLDYSLTLVIPVAGLDLGIGVVGTDVDKDYCDEHCAFRPVVSISKSL